MIRITRVSMFTSSSTDRAAHVWRTVASQPSWITRAALMTFLIVIGLPVVLLFLVALLLATAVFAVLATLHKLAGLIRGGFSRRDGRENVVVRRTGCL